MAWNPDSLDIFLLCLAPEISWHSSLNVISYCQVSFFFCFYEYLDQDTACLMSYDRDQRKTWPTRRISTGVLYTRGKSLFHLTVLVPLSITVMNVEFLKHPRSTEGTVNEMLLHYDIIKHMKWNRACRSKLQLIYWAQTDGSSDVRTTGKKARLSQYGLKLSISREGIWWTCNSC